MMCKADARARDRDREHCASGRPEVWLCQSGNHPVREVARELLLTVLAGYLGMQPDWVPLHLEPGRAPVVDARWQGMKLSISMSYAGGVALRTLCPGARVGVDLVEMAPMPACWPNRSFVAMALAIMPD
jgi:phosphopantetheinyl transferase